MAKKSTKTAHVLNLISKSAEQDPTTQADETQATEQVQQSPTSPLLSSLKETAKNEELSDKIKDNLLAELLEEESANMETHIQTTPPPESAVLQEPQKDVTTSEPVLETMPSAEIPTEAPTSQTSSETVAQQITQPNDAVQTAPPETQEIQQPEPVATEEPQEPEFHFINVGELLIKDKVMEYLEKFDVCTCSRCVADTMAIALSNLTPKYVVSDDSDVVPFLSYYDSKFTNQIMTELTKACLTVDANPRHKPKNS